MKCLNMIYLVKHQLFSENDEVGWPNIEYVIESLTTWNWYANLRWHTTIVCVWAFVYI